MFRVRRWVPIVAILALLGFMLEVGLARASEMSPEGRPYREGPSAESARATVLAGLGHEWPNHAEELLGLGVLAGVLCGFRASGLARGRLRRSADG